MGEVDAGDLQVFPVNITLVELRWLILCLCPSASGKGGIALQ